MQEIAPKIYIETGFPGVTLGAINWPHGLILIDAPFRAEDARSWRSALLNLGGGVDRILVNLDDHLDRVIGVRNMDCTVVAHASIADNICARPATFRPQPVGSGAEWEQFGGLGTVRWALPEISFNEQLEIYWDTEANPLVLQHHPGPSNGSIWAILPDHQIIFVGDTVTPGEPPFLECADLPAWIKSVERLKSDEFNTHVMISSRSGIIHAADLKAQHAYLTLLHERMEELAQKKAAPEKTESLIPELLKEFHISPEKEILYQQRLAYGLRQYYVRTYLHNSADPGFVN
ncbi:hypothetical protein ADN00_02350 [Ornatilinea apprima]|uniref:Metallo-beta-lactamase domain-containing protein n=1 Tax=Ornatilinea apprima TaxID=1134406 RepID=A0A0P6XSF7_9CHLR|nr:MBL fold metallo-hydrolase [Ornatilinea apprima]KPL79659.1 hypothetical protein ADN00_02350 [Ornatilinea apprima]